MEAGAHTPNFKGFFNSIMSSKYQAELSTKHWQDRSHAIKTRDNLKCQAFNCATPDSPLQVHHIDYISHQRPWQYPDDMLVSLCSTCHEKEQTRYHFESNLFTALKMKGFLACDILALTTLLYVDKTFLNSLLSVIRTKKNG